MQNIALNLYPGNLKLSGRKCTLTGILCLQITVGGGRRARQQFPENSPTSSFHVQRGTHLKERLTGLKIVSGIPQIGLGC